MQPLIFHENGFLYEKNIFLVNILGNPQKYR